MDQFQDPSIISLVPGSTNQELNPTQYESTNQPEDNAITKFLREAEYKREEEEESKRNAASSNEVVSEASQKSEAEPEEDEETKALRKEHELENWKLDLGPYQDEERLRYEMDVLYSLKDSPDNFVPEGLPNLDYYRLKAKQPQRTNYTNRSNNGGNYNGRNNYNEGGPSTGSMGNFQIKNRRGHDRGFTRYGGEHNNNNHHGRRNREPRNKKNNDDDASWLAELEKGGLASGRSAGTAEDFEQYRAKIKMMERRKNGEVVEEPSAPVELEDPKNLVDNLFISAKPSLAKAPSSSNASVTGDSGRRSKFMGIFSQGQAAPSSTDDTSATSKSAASNDSVSKILSLLDSGEKNAQTGSNNTTPQLSQASITSPNTAIPGKAGQRSQFSFQQDNASPSVSNPSLPPGLSIPSGAQGQSNILGGGNKDQFFMSLLNKAPDNKSTTSSTVQTPSPEMATKRTTPKVDDSNPSFPPGFQAPPGLAQSQQQLAQQSQPQRQQQAQQAHQAPQSSGQPQFPPGFPPQFQNPQNRGQGPQGQFGNGPLPGFNPQQPPPWMAQQFVGGMPQGRFMHPPVPNNAGFPPQMRQGGPQGSNVPQRVYFPQEFQGTPNQPPVFYPPFGGPNGPENRSNGEGQQREPQQGFPPGFFPPPGFPGGNSNQQ